MRYLTAIEIGIDAQQLARIRQDVVPLIQTVRQRQDALDQLSREQRARASGMIRDLHRAQRALHRGQLGLPISEIYDDNSPITSLVLMIRTNYEEASRLIHAAGPGAAIPANVLDAYTDNLAMLASLLNEDAQDPVEDGDEHRYDMDNNEDSPQAPRADQVMWRRELFGSTLEASYQMTDEQGERLVRPPVRN